MMLLPNIKNILTKCKNHISNQSESQWSLMTYTLAALCLFLILASNGTAISKTISPVVESWNGLRPLETSKKGYQVYGYAPYWTINKLDNVDFNALTTIAYFGVPLDSEGNLVKSDPGYTTFMSDKATQVFRRAHEAGTKVNLTVTQMDNETILAFLDNEAAQQNAVEQIVREVKNRGIDGVSIDIEYSGNPGYTYKTRFSNFVAQVNKRMHEEIPHTQVTVAVYASSARHNQLYDIAALAKSSDSIFMMAYDFAVAKSKNAAPTAPLYGKKSGKFSYDVSTAVEDFLKLMPAEKLILGVPYYGYNYVVSQPKVNTRTLPSWVASPAVQTYSIAQANVGPDMTGIDEYQTGWDEEAQVGWRAYRIASTNTWRMIFLEDEKSLGKKYDFAKEQNLAGVGIWALGFDNGHPELWALLREKFGAKLADNRGLLYK